jgi:response regulator RpfG family c-di-GMP phosphodiesterase
MHSTQKVSKQDRTDGLLYMLLLCSSCILLNQIGIGVATALQFPVFLDSIGTLVAAAIGGYLPGIAVGFLTNLISSVGAPENAYYGTLNVLIAVAGTLFAYGGFFKNPFKALLTVPVFAVIGGALGSLMTWFLYGLSFGEGISQNLTHYVYRNYGLSAFQSQLTADLAIDLVDKTIVVLIAILVIRLIPKDLMQKLSYLGWKQTPMSSEAKELATQISESPGSHSMRVKIPMIIGVATISLAVVATSISYVLFKNASIDEHTQLASGISSLVASLIDGDRVSDYLSKGEEAEGYLELKEQMNTIRNSSPSIEYIYVYRILPDGCHVVFDLDTEDTPGSPVGEVIPFDQSFESYRSLLLAGMPIDPIVTDDTYGWLLTVYTPVYDSMGHCQCYAAVDISMNQLRTNSYGFLTKVISLFLGFFIMILALGLWLAEYNIILPINAMSLVAGSFAYNSENSREESLQMIQELDIHTRDEIENLYHSLVKTTEDTVGYIADAQKQAEQLTKMQNGLILVLADLVESRDKCTGDHVRKTAAYTKVIMDEMRKEGLYADRLTDAFMEDVVNSAPLHDIGKIHVPDAILNKPGKLTDEEFHKMQEHTTAGKEIIESTISSVSVEAGYLKEARNLAAYHHEKWNGKGYPCGLAGEEIPLSARIMAVADVFDALVSTRSYKKPFPFEKAMDIIREGAGSHFDPLVAQAFLNAEDEVRRISEANDASAEHPLHGDENQ